MLRRFALEDTKTLPQSETFYTEDHNGSRLLDDGFRLTYKMYKKLYKMGVIN